MLHENVGRGKTCQTFYIEFTWPPRGNEKVTESLKELSYLKYGRDRELVEAAVMEKYKKEPVLASALPGIAKSPFMD